MALEVVPVRATSYPYVSEILEREPLSHQYVQSEKIAKDIDLLIGARYGVSDAGNHAVDVFDGRISNPSLYNRVISAEEANALHRGAKPEGIVGLMGAWNFGRDIGTRHIRDISGNGCHGQTVNMPTRGLPGPWWQRQTTDYTDAPDEYTAIHFHNDDLDDAQWEPTLEWDVPRELESGIYGLRLKDDEGNEDCLPIFIRPGGRSKKKVLFLAPVLSYLAYANQHIFTDDSLDFLRENAGDVGGLLSERDKFVVENGLHSLYDRHDDGSAVLYSSWLRPLVTMRHDYVSRGVGNGRGGTHQLSADLHIVDWLYQHGYEYDVATDIDLHAEGSGLLRDYSVVMTGSHPEYSTRAVIDALEEYTTAAGRLMYLGGNGFYWVTGFDIESKHTIEVRRWGGTQIWQADVGARHMTTTGELGGLWRNRGLAPQRLVGTGFAGSGEFAAGSAYKRTAESFCNRAGFIFRGVNDTYIGDFTNVVTGYGAAGY
ncbi:N,N-dimethylformamidase beta subunit family domain-containing protein, partial [Phytoactinopolyspora endophytica]|uniref:N,N-dimethylformamidase beta subunit family domain-containing protein n=1 Tax=Phytoactinopolyspora endophytica TaxID=1642495 RepID=UPI0030B818AD